MGELATNITSVCVWLGPEALCLHSSPPPVHTEPVERPRLLAHHYKPVVASFGSFRDCRVKCGHVLMLQTCQNPDFHVCELCFLLPVMWGTKCLTWKPHADVNWFSPDKETSVEVYWIWSPETKNKFLTSSQDSGTSALTSPVSTDTALSALSLFSAVIPSLYRSLSLSSSPLGVGVSRESEVWRCQGLKLIWSEPRQMWCQSFNQEGDGTATGNLTTGTFIPDTVNPKSNSTEVFYSLTVSALHQW